MTVLKLSAFEYLLGEWIGEGGGTPGQGASVFSFAYDLDRNILMRRNSVDFAATQDRPAFNHTDLTIHYIDGDGGIRAIYFDNEGHTIRYSTIEVNEKGEISLISDSIPGAPRFHFTYIKQNADKVLTRFEMTPPGKLDGFKVYVEGLITRKK